MLAIIPARGGSKGLPGKNIKKLNGLELIAYTIKAAQKSEFITEIIVSTDDQNIADIAKAHGVQVPFLRPAELASDTAIVADTYMHVLASLDKEYSSFVALNPTSPLKEAFDIDNAIKLFKEKDADVVLTVFEAETPIEWYKKLNDQGVLENIVQDKRDFVANRQDLERQYIPNGAVYIFKSEYLKKNKNYYGPKTFGHIMPKERSIDIDTALDFKIAELLIKEKGQF